MEKNGRIYLLGLSFWLAALGGFACSVPVFRYALELWKVDPYTIYLIHDGEQAVEVDEADTFLNRYAERGALNTMRVNMADPRVAEAIRRRGIVSVGSLPRIVAVLPKKYSEGSVVVMDEPLTTDTLNQLVDSPVRRELARRLISGESAVWLLLESGNRKKDDATEKQLQTQLDKLAMEVKLPELEPEDMRLLDLRPDDLKIGFSILRFSREDPNEGLLIQILLHSDPALNPASQEPVIFPVFGRGRKLASFSEGTLSEDNITEATEFMTGSCSCEIKESNPGMDLLMPIDWDKYIDNLIGFDASMPPLTGYAQFIPPSTFDTENTAVDVQEPDVAASSTNPLLRNLFILGGAFAVILGVFSYIVLGKKKKSGSK